jgi:hypothetical protein
MVLLADILAGNPHPNAPIISTATPVDPFPAAITLGFDTTYTAFNNCGSNAAQGPNVTDLSGAVADVTGNPAVPPTPATKNRADLDQLALAYYDCIVARHP